MVAYRTGESFVQIVYAKVKSNGKTELVPLKLYVDNSLEQLQSTLANSPHTGNDKMLLANRYEMQRVLGQGGFGRTYLTFDRYRFNEPCVVKEFLPQQRSEFEDRKSRELFEREAKILHQLDLPQIPKFFACFEENNRLFLVQEYIKGQTYSALLRERQQQGKHFTEIEIIEFLKNLLPVLTYLHERQIVHRDISPDNIILAEDCQLPILIDFGIGRSALVQAPPPGENPTTLVSSPSGKSIVGKLGYAPHEQIWLGHSFPSSDLYALAVTAIVLMTGLDPQTACMRDLWHHGSSVSEGLIQILNRMLADMPSHRYQSAAEVLVALAQHLGTTSQVSSSRQSQNHCITTLMQPAPPQPLAPTQLLPTNRPSDDFIARCERELLNYIGPIAKFLVKDTLVKYPNLSSEAVISALAAHIPQPDRAREFRTRLLQY